MNKKYLKFLTKNIDWIFILGLAILTRFLFISVRPFDGDEGLILKMTQQSNLKAVFIAAQTDVHPPLLNFFVYIAQKIFGLSEFSARFFPVLAGLGVIIFSYLIGRKIYDKKIGFIAAVLTSISSVLVYSAQEVRYYAFLTFFFLVGFYVILKLKEKESWQNYFWFTLTGLGLVYSQYLGWFLLVFLGLIFIWQKKFYLKIWKMLICFAVIMLVYIPQFPVMFHQIKGRTSEHPLTFSLVSNLIGVFNGFYRFVAGRIFLDIEPSLGKNLAWLKDNPLQFGLFLMTLFLPATILIFSLWINRKNKKTRPILVLFVFSILIALAYSEVGGRSVRYLIFLTPFYYILLSSGLIYLWQKKVWGKVLGLIFLFVFCWALINYYAFTVRAPGENAVASTLAKEVKSNEVILVKGSYGGGDSFALNYYWPKNVLKPTTIDFYGNYKVGNLPQLKKVKLEDKVNELKNQYQGVWYFDFTYSQDSLDLAKVKNVQSQIVGYDKENKPINIWHY